MDNGTKASGVGDLQVQGQNIQYLFQAFTEGSFLVNRRYQRKLVWTVGEKQALIDSIVNNLPIPLVLLAEAPQDPEANLEIIDGLQRLNAVFSFIENEYPFEGEYFDLETLADTKLLLDNKQIIQKEPKLDRETCRKIANYQLPISTFRSASEESVDEVFRRINSSGKKLSLQEIRQAGVTSDLADLVRKIAASIRGDASKREIISLSEVPEISISGKDLEYGVDSESIFWVDNQILDRESVRESRDEELILDLALDIILDTSTVTGREYRDSAYGKDTKSPTASDLVNSRLRLLGVDTVYSQFLATLEVFREMTKQCQTPWASYVMTRRNSRPIPRYFHAAFIAIHDLLYRENMEVSDIAKLTESFNKVWDGTLSEPGRGGNWGVTQKKNLIGFIISLTKGAFKPSTNPVSRKRKELASAFEVQLQMAVTEKALFELKQGFTSLTSPVAIDKTSLDKVLRTASAMANTSPGTKGQIFFGVADSSADAERIRSLHSVPPLPVKRFFVTGTSHELVSLNVSVDDHMRWLIDYIRNSKLERSFADALCSTVDVFEYEDRLIWSLAPSSQKNPVTWDDNFYIRRGSSTYQVKGSDVISLANRFSSVR